MCCSLATLMAVPLLVCCLSAGQYESNGCSRTLVCSPTVLCHVIARALAYHSCDHHLEIHTTISIKRKVNKSKSIVDGRRILRKPHLLEANYCSKL